MCWRSRQSRRRGGGNPGSAAGTIGIGTRVASYQAIGTGAYGTLDLDGVQLICLSYMNPASLAHARYAVRRLRRRTDVPIIVGFWSVDPAEPKAPDLVTATRSDLAATSLSDY